MTHLIVKYIPCTANHRTLLEMCPIKGGGLFFEDAIHHWPDTCLWA